ncbi:hypothetical protein HFP51_14415 [Parasphingopyxis sp. CP4]|uniref:hypothetical protein n=1 Tax=Parasphingopyxis sp. CP4 TaxID=2724527 RepID=UPI0015A4BFA3|nr:hypothetical protein [Parasphingopyxis sp. CP4]QLC23278.1 hypothetical protein HFP51_14415 [Parasphingopyxis sp. CP4]
MNTIGKTLMGATAATALAVAAPAQARDNDGIDAGDVIAGVLVLGGIAAVAAAIDGNDDNRYERHHTRHGDYNYRGDYRRGDYRQGQRLRPRQAVNRCRRAARQEASRYGRAQVTEITEVDRRSDGYRVRGRLLVEEGRYGRRGYRTADYDRGRFSCRVRYGQIDRLRVRGLN